MVKVWLQAVQSSIFLPMNTQPHPWKFFLYAWKNKSYPWHICISGRQNLDYRENFKKCVRENDISTDKRTEQLYIENGTRLYVISNVGFPSDS